MIHSLDHATSTLNSSNNIKDPLNVDKSSLKHLQSIARRLYRLFSHAFYHHEEHFYEFEAETKLCRRFTDFCKNFKMMSNDLFIIPEDKLDKSDNDQIKEKKDSEEKWTLFQI